MLMTADKIEYKILDKLPAEYKEWIEASVDLFVFESNCQGSKFGVIQQTLESIIQATELKVPGRYFWLIIHNSQPAAYVLTHVGKDVDNQLCYWITQAFVDPKYRHFEFIRDTYQHLKKHAENLFCKHILIVSSRNPKAYMKWLKSDLEEYATILKEDI